MEDREEPSSTSRGKRPARNSEADADLGAVRAAWVQLLGGLISAVAFLILFAWLSDEVFEGSLEQFDLRIRTTVHAFSTPLLTHVMQALTFVGSTLSLLILLTVSVVIFLFAGMKRSAIWLTLAAAGSSVLDISLKLAFHRARPVPFFGSVPLTYSFPSGHALSSLCFYGVLAALCCARIRSRSARVLIWIVTSALIMGIGLSRIYLGVHYPTDVIAGYLAGALWVSTLLFAARIRGRAPQTG